MPGVLVTTSTLTGPSTPGGEPAGRALFAGITERGINTSAVKVISLTDYETKFGIRASYAGSMHDAAQTFFEEGGSELWVARATGPAAVAGSLTLVDKAGAPLPTLKITALGVGPYSAELTVSIAAGTIANTYTLSLFRNGVQVEQYVNLPDITSAVVGLNSSLYVRGLDLGSVTAAPNNIPAVLAATALAGGLDDRASVTPTVILNTVNNLFVKGIGSGAVAAPGYDISLVGVGLLAHGAANRRIAILSGTSTQTNAQLITAAAAITTNGKYGGLFGPWTNIPFGSGILLIDPVGYIAGQRANAMNVKGFWYRPAGDISLSQFAVSTAYPVDESANNVLAAGKVNGIVTYPFGMEIMGYYSLDSDVANYGLLSAQDTINSISNAIELVLHQYVWAPIDGTGQLFGEIDGAIRGILQPLADSAALYPRFNADGSVADPGYSVLVSAANNPVDQLGNNTVAASVGIRLSPAAAMINVTIYKAPLSAAL